MKKYISFSGRSQRTIARALAANRKTLEGKAGVSRQRKQKR